MNKPTWKDKTCEKCVYNIDGTCRRFPPVVGQGMNIYDWYYPTVSCNYFPDKKLYKKLYHKESCAEYKERADE